MHKPPTLLVHDEVESIEFMRQGGGVLAASAKTFDLLIRMRNNSARPQVGFSAKTFDLLIRMRNRSARPPSTQHLAPASNSPELGCASRPARACCAFP